MYVITLLSFFFLHSAFFRDDFAIEGSEKKPFFCWRSFLFFIIDQSIISIVREAKQQKKNI